MGNRFRLAATFVSCSVAATAFTAVSLAQPAVEDRTVTSERRDRPPSELWDEFPLEEPTRARAPASPRSDRVSRSREPMTVESGDSEVSTNQQLLLLAAIAALALLGPAVLFGPAVFALVRPRRPARARVAAVVPPAYRPPRLRATVPSRDRSTFVAQQRALLLAAMRGPGTTQARVQAARAIAIEALELNMVSSENAEGRLEPVEENTVRPAVEGDNARDTAVEDESALSDVTQLGDRVAAVLRAAEEAAEQIRTDAQAAAERITSQAEHDAKARLEESRREAVRVLSDAETQARASREAAEAMVQRIQESARSLEEEVREQERMIRGRMQRYLAGLRDVSGQIETVLHETEREAPPLVEALNVERANHQH
jgi:hypothetical protein